MKRLAVLALALAACRGGRAKVHRTGSAAPVELVTQVPADAGASGAVSDEVEPNDADDVATLLPLGGRVRARIDSENDTDHFRIDVPSAGTLQVMVSRVDQDLVLELEDASGNVIARSTRGGVRVVEGLPNVGVTPGRYTAVVHAAPRKKPPPRRGRHPAPEPKAPPGPVYEISAQMVQPPQGAEHEPNDDRGTANDLLPQDTVTGYLGWAGDEDEWKLSAEALSAKNALAVVVAPVEGVAIELEVTDALGQRLLLHKGNRGDGARVDGLVPAIAPGAAPFLYVIVRGDKSNPETPYQLHTEATLPNPDDEAEPDDTPDHPYQLPPDRTVVHATWDAGDTDCFAIAPAPDPRAIEVTVDTPSELDLAAELFVEGASVAKVDHPGKGVPEKIGAPLPGNAHAVACVHAVKEGPGRTKIAYDVHVQESAATGDNAP